MGMSNGPRWQRAVLLIVAVAVSVAFAVRAGQHADRWNNNLQAFDQGAYLHFAQKVHGTGFGYWTDGARGPAYPFLLALLVRPGVTDEEHFALARKLSIALALVALTVLGFLLCRWLPRHAALNVLWISTFSVFLFRAPYVQPEPLFYVAFLAGFVLAWQSLVAPGIQSGAKAGVALGLAHLLKPATLPALGLLVMAGLGGALASLVRWSRRSWLARDRVRSVPPSTGGHPPDAMASDGTAAVSQLATLLATIGAFLVVVAPYLVANVRTFGRPFYNVNTTFYLWYDSWEEVKAGTRAHGDRTGWPQMPAEEMPSLAHYLATHSAADVLRRFAVGGRQLLTDGLASRGYGRYAFLYALAALVSAATDRRRVLARLRACPGAALFGTSFFVVYLAGFAWFGPINYGERLIQSLVLPWLYACAVVVHRSAGPVVALPGRVLSWARGTEMAITALAIPDGILAFGWRILRLAGGP